MSTCGSAPESPSVAAARLLQIIEARFGDGLKAARAPCARGPRPGSEQLRLAYLDLLKLCLCDLGGSATTSVARTTEGDVMSRELAGEELRFRTAGMDWPLHGLTMVGLARLDDLQACVESISRDGVTGDLIEAGTWRGGASILARATLDSLGEDERTVWVADSFQGFPQAGHNEDDGYDLGIDLARFDFLAVPLEEVKENFVRFGLEQRVKFLSGFFEETLPTLTAQRWSLVRLDGDTYDATRLSLEALYPTLSSGGYVVIDDYVQLDQCRQAVDDFRHERGVTEPLEEVDWSCMRWRRESEPPPAAQSESGQVAERVATDERAPQAVARAPRGRVPAIEEVQLSEELSELRRRLNAAEAEIERLAGSPLRGPKAWLGRRLRSTTRSRP